MSKDLQELTAKIARRLELSKHTATVKYIRSDIETFIEQNYTPNTELERRVKIDELEIALGDADMRAFWEGKGFNQDKSSKMWTRAVSEPDKFRDNIIILPQGVATFIYRLVAEAKIEELEQVTDDLFAAHFYDTALYKYLMKRLESYKQRLTQLEEKQL